MLAVITNGEWNPRRARHDMGPYAADLPHHINVAREALEPVNGDWLYDRLSTMQLACTATSGWSEARATAWLHETQRLLADLPQDIVADAIDQAVKQSGRGFLPSVGEIRALADPRFDQRRRVLRRLESVGALPATPAPAAPVVPPVTEEEREAIKAEFGITTTPYVEAAKPTGVASRMPTPADVADIAKQVGLNPAAVDATPAAPIDGLTISEIFAQRDRRRTEQFTQAEPEAKPEPINRSEHDPTGDETDDVERYFT